MSKRSYADELFDASPAFLEAEAAPWAVRGLATFLTALFVAAVLAAALIRVPETVTSRFVLVPLHRADPVRAPRAATVTAVQVLEGQSVSHNDTLFVLRSESVGDRASELQTEEAIRDGAAESLANQNEEFQSRQRADEGEIQNLAARLSDLDEMLALKRDALELTRDVVARYQELHKRDLLKRTELARYELAAKKAQFEFEELESDHAQVEAKLQRLRHEAEARQVAHREAARVLREEITRAEIRITTLEEGLTWSEGSQISVPAPCEGTVLRLHVTSPGAFLKDGEVLADLACANEPLRAKLTIPQADVARLEAGQGVKFLYDAFPHQRHGIRFGILRWVSPASIEENGAHVFRALADVHDESILVNGKERPLMAGMGGKAKIVVGRRTLLGYAFEPLYQLRESVIDAPADPTPRAGS
jgi:multidrug efflux pump subunit AcrA (membrane-fusion protein)